MSGMTEGGLKTSGMTKGGLNMSGMIEGDHKLTNEGQHLAKDFAKVLAGEPPIITSPLKPDVSWLTDKLLGARSGTSRQLWIARHPHRHPFGIEMFFCDPHAPWQKGGVKHALGRRRLTLPRKADIATLLTQRVHQLVHAPNHTPCTCLGYATPAEMFIHQVLHLKCESTCPRARE